MTADSGDSGDRKRLGWRRWRRTRPFWGALLVVLGAAEILVSERAPLPVMIHVGLQGLAGFAIPIVMLLCGLLLAFHPVQRTFYSILAVLLALGSWITANLGGFFIGMLLGLIGGSLAFAWQPPAETEPRERRRWRPRRNPSAGLDLVLGRRPADHGRQERPGRQTSSGPGAAAASRTIPLASLAPLAVSMLITPMPGGVGMPSRMASSHPPTPATLSPGGQTPPLPSESASPSSVPTRRPEPSPSPRRTPSRAAHRKQRRRRHVAVGRSPRAPVLQVRSRLSAGLVTCSGLSFAGVAKVPSATGKAPMLEFRMSSLTLSGRAMLVAAQGGHSSVSGASSFGFRGDVVLYATKVSGSLNGAPVTFTPQRPPQGLPSDVTLTGFVADEPYITANSLLASGYRFRLG